MQCVRCSICWPSIAYAALHFTGRDQRSLDDDYGGQVAASYTLVLFPTIAYVGEIQVLTEDQQYEGGLPTITGGAPPIRYHIQHPATLPPGLHVDEGTGRIHGAPSTLFRSQASYACYKYKPT